MDPEVGQVWECRQDGRLVKIIEIDSGRVILWCSETGKRTHVQRAQFTRRYRPAS